MRDHIYIFTEQEGHEALNRLPIGAMFLEKKLFEVV